MQNQNVSRQDHLNQYWFAAAAEDNISIITRLVASNGKKISADDKTALMTAAEHNATKVVQFLTSAEYGIQNKYGATALMYAAHGNYPEIARMLSYKESGLYLRSRYFNCPPGSTAQYVALTAGNIEMAAYLAYHEECVTGINQGFIDAITGGSDVLLQDSMGRTPLHYFIILGKYRSEYQSLRQYKALEGRVDKNGYTALMYLVIDLQKDRGSAQGLLNNYISTLTGELRVYSEQPYHGLSSRFSALMLALHLHVPVPLCLAEAEVGIVSSTGYMAVDFINGEDCASAPYGLVKILQGEHDVQRSLRRACGENSNSHLFEEEFEHEEFGLCLDGECYQNGDPAENEVDYGTISDPQEQLDHLRRMLKVSDVNLTINGLMALYKNMREDQERYQEHEARLKYIYDSIDHYQDIVRRKKDACRDIYKQINDLKKTLNDLKGEYKVDDYTTMRDEGADIALQTDERERGLDFTNQFPEPDMFVDKSLQVRSDDGQVDIYQQIMDQVRQMMRCRRENIRQYRDKIRLQQTQFNRVVDHVAQQFSLESDMLEMELVASYLTKFKEGPDGPAEAGGTDAMLLSRGCEDGDLGRPRTIVSLQEYQEILTESQQYEDALTETQKLNAEIVKRIEQLRGRAAE